MNPKRYMVTYRVLYAVCVEAESVEEAIIKAESECPYDHDPSVEPYVEEVIDL